MELTGVNELAMFSSSAALVDGVESWNSAVAAPNELARARIRKTRETPWGSLIVNLGITFRRGDVQAFGKEYQIYIGIDDDVDNLGGQVCVYRDNVDRWWCCC